MADRPSLLDRYSALNGRAAELAALAPHYPSDVHRACVEALVDMLTMAQRFSTGKVPAPLRAMVRTLQRMQDVLVEEIANVPPDQIRVFMRDLAGRLTAIADTTDHANLDGPAAQPDQPPGA